MLIYLLVPFSTSAEAVAEADRECWDAHITATSPIQNELVARNALPLVLAASDCGSHGPVEIELHRVVDGEAAELVAAATVTTQQGANVLGQLQPDNLLPGEQYALHSANDTYLFGAPTFEVEDREAPVSQLEPPLLTIESFTVQPDGDSARIAIDFIVEAVTDGESMGFEIGAQAGKSRWATITDHNHITDSAEWTEAGFDDGERCFTVTQTSLYGETATSEACLEPELVPEPEAVEPETEDSGCSTVASPASFAWIGALALAVARCRGRR